MSGLRANQAALALVSSNVANAETPGYVRKTSNQVQTAVGNGAGVETIGVNRVLDDYIQSQLRTETSGAAYTRTRANFLSNLQSVYGDPDSSATIEAAFNSLTTALQSLSTSPDSQSARTGVINAAQALAQQLNSTSQGIQALRNSAETGITNAVSTANNALIQIAKINRQLQGYANQDAATAALLDQRDQFITQVSQLMDVRVVKGDGNQVSVYTTSGTQLVGGSDAAQLSFNTRHGHAGCAVECRSIKERARNDFHFLCERRKHRSGFKWSDPIRINRGLSRIARQNAGAGTGTGRPARGSDGKCAVRQDDRRHAIPARYARSAARNTSGLRSRSFRSPGWQRCSSDLHRQHRH